MTTQIRIRGLHKSFETGGMEVAALRGIDLDVARGEFVCVLGPSGCGKSTLLNAVAGFIRPTAGEIAVEGRPVTEPGPDRGVVFQEYALFPWMTVGRNVAFGLEVKGTVRREIDARVGTLLAKLGLAEFRDRYPRELSGGMRQRVAIARILAIDSPILLMDEPFGALDALTRLSLQEELLRIWSELGRTIIFVTHSIQESLSLADRVIVMTYRPGTVKKVVPVDLPRPREITSAPFLSLQQELTALVMEEQLRYQKAQV